MGLETNAPDFHPAAKGGLVYKKPGFPDGNELVILLAGGDKSTQASDIKTALPLSRNTYVLAYDFFSFVSRPLVSRLVNSIH